MATTKKTKRTQANRPSTIAPRSPTFPPERRPDDLTPFSAESDPQPEPRRAGDRVGLVLMISALVVLAGVLASQLVTPAVTTLADPSPTNWSGEGP